MGQHIYLDTGILVPLLWDRDADQREHCETIIEDVRGAVQSHDHTVKIPKLALGEAMSRYSLDVDQEKVGPGHEPSQVDFIERLYDITSQVDAVFESVPTKSYELAQQLHEKDRELTTNDLFIATTALLDGDSTHLLALDGDFVEKGSITRLSREMVRDGQREYPLKVRDSYSSPHR